MKYPKKKKKKKNKNKNKNKNENNVYLNIGQKQLICIARIFLLNPKILLIDEAIKNLESPYREMAQSALELAAFDSSRTTLIITHQFDIIKKVDKIIVMDDGKVAESGSHNELINQHAAYYDLIKHRIIKSNENSIDNFNGTKSNIFLSEMDDIPIDDIPIRSDLSVDSQSNFIIKDLNIKNNIIISSINNKNSIDNDLNINVDAESKEIYNTNNKSSVSSKKIINCEYSMESSEKSKKHFIPWKYIFLYNKSFWLMNIISVIGSFLMSYTRILCGFLIAVIFCIYCKYQKLVSNYFDSHVILTYTICGLAITIASYFSITCSAFSGDRIAFIMRKDMIKSIFRQEVAYIESFRINEKINSLTDKLNRDNAFIHYINVYLNNIIAVVSSIILMFTLTILHNKKLLLTILIFAPIIIVVSYIFTKVLKVNYSKKRIAYEKSSKYIVDMLHHIRMIHALDIKDYCLNIYNEKLIQEVKALNSKNLIYSIIAAFDTILQPMMCCVGFSFGFHFLKEDNITMLNMFIVIIVAIYAVKEASRIPFSDSSNFFASIEIFINNLKIIHRSSKIDATNSHDGLKNIELKGKISFNDNVIFNLPSYPNVPVLNIGVNKIEISEKKTVVIIGEPDSGKSELLQLIPRLYDIQHGKILIDDCKLTDYNVKWLRQQIGYIEAKPNIYNYSFRNNICVGKKDATEEEIIEAAKIANIHNYIKSFPDGYNYQIENPNEIKDSLKHKIAIARALVRKPKILLIDQPNQTSSDEDSRIVFQKFINKLIKNHNHERTTIITTDHLFNNIDKVDMIMIMREGKIVEKGSHDELITLKGEYYKMNLTK